MERKNPVDRLSSKHIQDMLAVYNAVEASKGFPLKPLRTPTEEDKKRVNTKNIKKEFDGENTQKVIDSLIWGTKEKIVRSPNKRNQGYFLSDIISESPSDAVELVGIVLSNNALRGAVVYFETIPNLSQDVRSMYIISYLKDGKFWSETHTKMANGETKKVDLSKITHDNQAVRTWKDYEEFERIKIKINNYLRS